MSYTNNAASAAAASSTETNKRNVRQRSNPLGLECLPDDTLLRVATYLSHTTRALLSVALTAPSTSYDLGGHNENEKDLIAKKMELLLRENGWQSATSDSLTDVLSYAIETCKITKINNNPQHVRHYQKQVRLYYPIHIIGNASIMVQGSHTGVMTSMKKIGMCLIC